MDMGAVLVSGAGGSIGTAVCKQLVADGYTVVGLDTRPGTAITGVVQRSCDVSDPQAVAEVVAEVDHDTAPIVGLVNAAGVVSKGSGVTVSIEELERVWKINVLGTIIPTQLVAQRMASRKAGSIVNIGSVVAKNSGNARPWLSVDELDEAGGLAYGISKAAVHAMTGFLARELAPSGVRVNTVAPGPIESAMTTEFPENLRQLIPLGRMGRPSEVATVASFLLSDKASFITGETIDVNGALFCD